MTLIDILISASCGAAVVGAIWAGRCFYRDWQADIAFGEHLAEVEAQAQFDLERHPFLTHEADRLASEAQAARRNKKASKALSERAVIARNAQIRCEQRLRAAGYQIVLGGASFVGEEVA